MITSNTRRCNKCGEEKPRSEYPIESRTGRITQTCRACKIEGHRIYRRNAGINDAPSAEIPTDPERYRARLEHAQRVVDEVDGVHPGEPPKRIVTGEPGKAIRVVSVDTPSKNTKGEYLEGV